MKALICLLMLLLPAAAAAQDAAAAVLLLRGCLEASETRADGLACRGVYAQDCAAALEGGASTVGMAACAAAEGEGWDRLLNEVYADLVLLSRRQAIREEEVGVEPADLLGMLRDAQRAWIAFRDIDCAQEVAIWGEGSQRQVAGAYCVLDRTATRVLELRAKREQMQVREE